MLTYLGKNNLRVTQDGSRPHDKPTNEIWKWPWDAAPPSPPSYMRSHCGYRRGQQRHLQRGIDIGTQTGDFSIGKCHKNMYKKSHAKEEIKRVSGTSVMDRRSLVPSVRGGHVSRWERLLLLFVCVKHLNGAEATTADYMRGCNHLCWIHCFINTNRVSHLTNIDATLLLPCI